MMNLGEEDMAVLFWLNGQRGYPTEHRKHLTRVFRDLTKHKYIEKDGDLWRITRVGREAARVENELRRAGV